MADELKPRGRNYFITAFVEKVGYIDFVDGMKYMIDSGPEYTKKGKLHHHYGIIFKNQRYLSAVIKQYKGMDVELCDRPFEGTIKYCMGYKDGKLKRGDRENDYVEHGDRPRGKGFRSDLSSILDMVRQGATIREIALEAPATYARNYRGIDAWRYAVFFSKWQGWRPMECYIFWGKTRSGKTKEANERWGDSLYVKDETKWWCGYDGEETILADDFDPDEVHTIGFKRWLRIMGGYCERLEVKGHHLYMPKTCKRVVFTSNHDPAEWFVCRDKDRDAFFERIVEIKKF